MSEDTAVQSSDAPVTETTQAVEAPSAPEPKETQREIMARVFDSQQESETRKVAGDKPQGQPRGPNGQFTRDPVSGGKPAAPLAAGTTPNPTSPAAIDAPAGWSPEARALWASVSPDVQKHVAAREAELQTALETHTQRLKGYDNLDRVLDPFRDVLTRGYGGVDRGIATLLNLAESADRDFSRFVVEQARARNISPEQIASAFGTIPVPDPQTVALHREVQELRSAVSGYQSAQEQAISADAQRVIAEFKAKPENKHFDKLAPRIGALLKAGLADSLADAYRQAAATDTEISALIAKEKADADAAKAEAEAKERAAKARTASVVNIRTMAPAVGAPPKMSQRERMAATFDRMNGATS